MVPPYGEKLAIEGLPWCRRYRSPRAERRARERRPSAEGGCDWLCVPPGVCPTAVTLGAEEGTAAEPGTGVVPELPEVLAVEEGGPPESVEEPLAEGAEGELPAVDSGGLPEGEAGGLPGGEAGGLLVGGAEALLVGVPSDTLTSGAPGEDVPGKDTPIDGAAGEDVPRDTLTKGALGADPSGCGRLTEVPNSDTLTSGALVGDAVEELGGSGVWALAYPAASSAAHRPASSPAALAPTHRGRRRAMVRLCLPLWGV